MPPECQLFLFLTGHVQHSHIHEAVWMYTSISRLETSLQPEKVIMRSSVEKQIWSRERWLKCVLHCLWVRVWEIMGLFGSPPERYLTCQR